MKLIELSRQDEAQKLKRDIKPETLKMSCFGWKWRECRYEKVGKKTQEKRKEIKVRGRRQEADRMYTVTTEKGGQEKLNTRQMHLEANWKIYFRRRKGRQQCSQQHIIFLKRSEERGKINSRRI